MKYMPSVIVLVLVPVYVLSVFVADVFAPTTADIPQEDPLVMRFVGDLMFDRYIRERAAEHGYDAVLRDVAPQLHGADVVVGNLEGPITTFPPVSNWRIQNADHYRFTFATSVAQTLKGAGFTAFTLANNHIMNFGAEGYSETLFWLDAHKLQSFGTQDDPYEPLRFSKGAISMALYGFDLWYARDTQEVIKRIEAESPETFVVVYAHWGDEYELQPNAGQRELARRFIDSGADLVVGTHPHVIEPKEQYRDAWIYYSLGNFVFDQYFNADVRCGAGITVTVEPSGTYAVEEFFVELARDGTTKRSDCRESVATR